MTSHGEHATPSGAPCDVCGGPCLTPHRLPPIPAGYPFLPPEVIAMTHPAPEPVPDPDPAPKRGRRRGEDRSHHPAENASRQPAEDRS